MVKLVILGHFLPFTPVKAPKIKDLKNETFARDIIILRMCTRNQSHTMSSIFPSTFLQPFNSSKNLILNGVMKLNLIMCSFSFLFLKQPWKIFHSVCVFSLFGLDTYKHA